MLPSGPVVESYSPHRVERGTSYILVIEGKNLQSALVELDREALLEGLVLTSLTHTGDGQIISGLLIVPGYGAPGRLEPVHLLVGGVPYPIWIMPKRTQAPDRWIDCENSCG
ncbi:MAG: hypothetical protein QXP01_07035, partial [Candidatus Hadarchaeum sp.]